MQAKSTQIKDLEPWDASGQLSGVLVPSEATLLQEMLSPSEMPQSRSYDLCFAQSKSDLREVQRLRFAVFNEELNEGLDESRATGLDADVFDPQCQHLFVRCKKTGEIVGTYRMQSYETATSNLGFYSSTVFDLSHAPIDFLKNSVEIGRACIRKDHRSLHVLYML